MDNLKVKYKPIFDSEKFDLIALINFFYKTFKSYFKYYLILSIVFTAYFLSLQSMEQKSHFIQIIVTIKLHLQ